jgi:RIO kinase 1
MTDIISKKLESKIDDKLNSKRKRRHLDDGFKKGKVVNEVLDKSTVMTLYKMITDQKDVDIALKIYLVSTSNFKKREPYITGDPRFSHLKKGTKNMVYLWAKKEYRNLSQCYDAGIPVPKPLYVTNNVLAMEFMGDNGSPSKLLLTSEVDADDYRQAISIIKDLYNKANLVHGDFSEYNIFKTENGLVVFDLGSGVDLRHPNSKKFLKRDINNITRFFSKRGILCEDADKIFEEIIDDL